MSRLDVELTRPRVEMTSIPQRPPTPQTPPTEQGNQSSQPASPRRASSTEGLPLHHGSAVEEPRKCWICIADETEDTPTTSAWRSPCPCALTAHEACLLDWVADLEAPKGTSHPSSTPRIQCPQCKADITVARPTSLVVNGVQVIDGLTTRLLFPGIMLSFASGLFSFCWLHGVAAVFLTFDRSGFQELTGFGTAQVFTWKRALGLPLIPLALIASRTSLGDHILPAFPFFYFAVQVQGGHEAARYWPPSAAMTFATLPYVRVLYQLTMSHLFAERERRWIEEVQPRHTDAEPLADVDGRPVHVGPFPFNLDIEFVDEMAEGEHLGHQAEVQQAPREVDAQHDHLQADAAIEEVDPERPAENAPDRRGQRAGGMLLTLTSVAEVVLGALAFPAVASAMGSLIALGLPDSWIKVPAQDWAVRGSLRRPTLLQSRWGRTVLGGCLFVVMKDTLLLYTRYRLAQGHRERRIVDWAGQRRLGKTGQP